MSTELAIVDERGLTFVAKAFVESRMFGFKSMPEALSVLLLAQAEGLHPAAAAMEYGVIHGRPTRKADAILMCPGWERSKGALAEKTMAEEFDIPVFTGLQELSNWADDLLAAERAADPDEVLRKSDD
jgi:hypothetical protein